MTKRLCWGKSNQNNVCFYATKNIGGIGLMLNLEAPVIYAYRTIEISFKFLWFGAWYTYDFNNKNPF